MEEQLDSCQESGKLHSKQVEMRKLPIVDEEKLGISPFVQELVIEATKMYSSEAMVLCEDGIMIPASHSVEKMKSVKVYRYPGSKDRAMNLSAGALRMFVYIQYTIEGTNDWIQIEPDQYERGAKKGSLNVYKKAVAELWRYGYIFPTLQKHVYWVNPSLMFAGNRIDKWPDRVIVKNEYTKPAKIE